MVSFTGSTRAGEDVSKNAAATSARFARIGRQRREHCFRRRRRRRRRPAARGIALITAANRATRRRACWSSAPPTIAPWRPPPASRRNRSRCRGKRRRAYRPVVSATQREKSAASSPPNRRRRVLVAGGADAPPRLDRGYFVRPTVFADVTNEMTVAREEIFGPVCRLCRSTTRKRRRESPTTRLTDSAITFKPATPPKPRASPPLALRHGANQRPFARRRRAFRRLQALRQRREGGAWGIEEFLETKAVSGWE